MPCPMVLSSAVSHGAELCRDMEANASIISNGVRPASAVPSEDPFSQQCVRHPSVGSAEILTEQATGMPLCASLCLPVHIVA